MEWQSNHNAGGGKFGAGGVGLRFPSAQAYGLFFQIHEPYEQVDTAPFAAAGDDDWPGVAREFDAMALPGDYRRKADA